MSANGLVATDGAINVQSTAYRLADELHPDPTTGVPPITDPLAFLALPPDMSTLSVKSTPCTDGPGRYGNCNFPNNPCAR